MTKPKPYLDNRDLPAFTFYPQFAEEWEHFSGTERKVVGEFLGLLQERYDDPRFQREWEHWGHKEKQYWGAVLPQIEFRVIWRVVYPSHPGLPMASQPAKEIQILACEPVPGGPKKGP